MKKRNAVAALAVSAALAMGCAPAAFAATDGSVATGTTVSLTTTANSISAEVPLALTFAADANGGALTGPTEGGYYISNKSSIPIKVTDVKAELVTTGNGGKWALAASAGDLSSAASVTGAVGDLNLKLTVANKDAVDIYATSTDKKVTNWEIAGSSDAANPEKLVIVPSGFSTKLKTTTDAAVPAVKLTYTVAPNPSSSGSGA